MGEKFKDSKFIFVAGIGGSDLASKAVWQAMTMHKPDVDKKVFFLESPDKREYDEIKDLVSDEILNPNEFVLIAVSKTGKTAETLESYRRTSEILAEKFGDFVAERTIVISIKDTPLWKIAEEKNIERVEWEGNVGGRFSALTRVHTTIISIAGLNAEAFAAGGEEMKKKCGEEDPENPAKHLAQNIFDYYKQGSDVLDFFIFNSELEDLGKWCRQLIGESISLITPTVSLGPVDLHSMLELYLGGPKNRFTIFIRSLEETEGNVNGEAYKDVAAAYERASLPFIKYEMERISEKELGGFMQFMMSTTLELAKLLEIDPFDQPAVDEYKKHLAENK